MNLLEGLESRLLFAEIQPLLITLRDAKGYAITGAVPAGTVMSFSVLFSEYTVATTANYKVTAALGSQSFTGSYTGSNTSYYKHLEFKTPTFTLDSATGDQIITIRVDPANNVAETNENNNTLTQTLKVLSSGIDQKFVLPVLGTMNTRTLAQSYVDLDPGPGVLDYTGGSRAWDGSDGLDFVQAYGSSINMEVFAAAPGVVTAVNLGNPNAASNYITIDHGGGWVSKYSNLRSDSPMVEVGQFVAAGKSISYAAYGGRYAGAYLHFTLLKNGVPQETYNDPTRFWQNPWTYTGHIDTILASGITTIDPTPLLAKGEIPTGVWTYSSTTPGQKFNLYYALAARAGTTGQIDILKPDGTVHASYSYTNSVQRNGEFLIREITLPDAPEVGNWKYRISNDGAVLQESTFQVTTAGAPVIQAYLNGVPIADFATLDTLTHTAATGYASVTLTLKNIGTGPTTKISTTTSGIWSVYYYAPDMIPAGGSANVTLRYSTATAGFTYNTVFFSVTSASGGTTDLNYVANTSISSSSLTRPVVSFYANHLVVNQRAQRPMVYEFRRVGPVDQQLVVPVSTMTYHMSTISQSRYFENATSSVIFAPGSSTAYLVFTPPPPPTSTAYNYFASSNYQVIYGHPFVLTDTSGFTLTPTTQNSFNSSDVTGFYYPSISAPYGSFASSSPSSPNGYLTATVYLDSNRNGARDASEPYLGDMNVFVDDNNDGILQTNEISLTTQSNVETNRDYSSILSRDYLRVRLVLPSGYEVTRGSEFFRFVSGAEFGKATFGIAPKTTTTVSIQGAATIAEGLSIPLSATFDGPTPSSFQWDFNYDGTTFTSDATGTNATFSAANLDGPTTRTIALRGLLLGGGYTNITTLDISVTNAAPASKTSVSGRTINVLPATGSAFDAPSDVVRFSYDFNNDGVYELLSTDSTSVLVPLQYLASGSTTVRVKVEDDDGGFVIHNVNVSIPRPTAIISATSTSIPETSNFTFFGVSSTVTLGGSLTYEWDANYNGSTFNPTSTGASLTLTNLDGPSTRTVALRVTTAEGLSSLTTSSINITNVAPRATLSVSGRAVTVRPPTNSTFDISADPVTFDYDFNNDGTFDLLGSTSNNVEVPVGFLASGTSNLVVRVRDKDGGTLTLTGVAQYAVPSALITGATLVSGQVRILEGQTLTLSGQNSTVTSGSIDLWEWDFNYNGSAFNPTAFGPSAFADLSAFSATSRTIALRVTSSDGAVSIATLPVSISNSAPSVTISQTGNTTLRALVNDSPADIAAGFTYDFDFDNDGVYDLTGQSSPDATIPDFYLSRGPKTMSVRVTDQDGASSTSPFEFNHVPDAIPLTASITTDGDAPESAGQLSFLASISRAMDVDIRLLLDVTGNLSAPSEVIIPAGATSARFSVSFSPNTLPDDERSVSISVRPSADDIALISTTTPPASARVLDDDAYARIVTDPLDPKRKKGMLVVTGTDLSDVIELLYNKKGIEVRSNGASLGVFSKSAVRIITLARDGDDLIRVDPKLKTPSILLGQSGNDTLLGSAGKDLLIGGSGSDQLRGGKADDLLISGSIPNDSDLANLSFLHSIWNSSKAGKRAATLTAKTSLFSNTSLLNDNTTNQLFGESNTDMYLANPSDTLSSAEKKEEQYTAPSV